MSKSVDDVMIRFQKQLEESRLQFSESMLSLIEANDLAISESMKPLLEEQAKWFSESLKFTLEEQHKQVAESIQPILDAQKKQVDQVVEPMLEEQRKQVDQVVEPMLEEQRKQVEKSIQPILDAQKKYAAKFMQPFHKEQERLTKKSRQPLINQLEETLQESTANMLTKVDLEQDDELATKEIKAYALIDRLMAGIARTLVNDIGMVSDGDLLDAWRSNYVGRRSPINNIFSDISRVEDEHRAHFGRWANDLRNVLNATLEQQATLIREQAMARDLEEGEIDITLPAHARRRGGLHPATRTHREFQTIWADMGFQVYQSQDVEEDDFNFTLLNLPPHHPARDMQDTFYTSKPGVLLRTHTSPGQIRAMRELGEGGSKPIRVILPGMCYRQEQVTARSEIQFTQVEGLAIGRNIRMSDLKGTISEFAKRMFNPNAKVRYRASYFPFTEPSMEVDVECFLCGGAGCRVCKYTGWLEIAGSGMVHPTVLSNGGYDPSEWSGFAFGMGPERITMLKHGIQDIRYFWGNDLRFLQQF